ncbi:MAG: hypothetical protein A2Z40_00950 [Deltaproteobacteria bacterium RBG_19FT_COMBO_60_16]|nr:MAG: hypothetical protein A2Z13_02885 [Deltaproteobacteria bacterium RBG_16_64_85]OGQ00546.1 MAG: hypothetical protein A2Z40_00950 [Deltaproteobacteria bacterium RBG_19FT_COMBO_60_16]
MPVTVDYQSVTELFGEEVSTEQVDRICNRYYWAGTYCRGKDVLEAACGSGQGLGYLAGLARSIRAGDYAFDILRYPKSHYGPRISLQQFDAQRIPFRDHSFDVVILFEAIYYLPDADIFVEECRRVLRRGGRVLVATANKDLFDFNPSPYSHRYYGVVEMNELFARHGFASEFFGNTPVDAVGCRQRFLRPAKKIAVDLGIIPKTSQGKKILKRLLFGRLVRMPAEIEEGMARYVEPARLSPSMADKNHKVIYCAATNEGK